MINHQKAIADIALEMMFPIDPFAIVVGGAPRDWYFNKQAADIDLFFYVGNNTSVTIVKSMLEHVGFVVKGCKDAHNLPEHYKKNPMLRCVFDAVNFNGQDVQLMLMRSSTFKSVVPLFPLSICKAWYKNGTIMLDRDFERSVRYKAIVKTNELYSDEDAYLQKVLGKFPEYAYYESWRSVVVAELDKRGIK